MKSSPERKPPAPESVFVGEALRKWVIEYYKRIGLANYKQVAISFIKPNRDVKHWLIIASISHSIATEKLPYHADDDLKSFLNAVFTVPRYRVSVIQDTTYNHQNFHIRLIKR